MPTAFGVTVGFTRRVGIDAGGSCRVIWSRYLLVSMIEMPNALVVDPWHRRATVVASAGFVIHVFVFARKRRGYRHDGRGQQTSRHQRRMV
jgi:hypothetical protein